MILLDEYGNERRDESLTVQPTMESVLEGDVQLPCCIWTVTDCIAADENGDFLLVLANFAKVPTTDVSSVQQTSKFKQA